MIILNSDEVRQALPMPQAIQAMKTAYAALSAGRTVIPQRTSTPIADQQAVCLTMPAYLQDAEQSSLAVKVVSVFPGNPSRGLPLIHAAVLVLDAGTGKPAALIEGGTLTARRTGAATGAATDLLARPDSRVAAIFGAGIQGRTQLEAICAVRSIRRAWIIDPEKNRAIRFIEDMQGKPAVPDDLRIAELPAQALAEADIVCTATTSTIPVFDDRHLMPGTHINGVGSYTPEMQEVPAATVKRALVVVDSRSAALVEAGDLIQPLRQGEITESDIHAEIGEILLGIKPGRTAPNQVTFFKSVGIAVQDAAAAQVVLQNAEIMNLGQRIDF